MTALTAAGIGFTVGILAGLLVGSVATNLLNQLRIKELQDKVWDLQWKDADR